MDYKDPPIAFADLAKSLGMHAERVDIGSAFKLAYQSANESVGPALLEVMVQGGETMQDYISVKRTNIKYSPT